MARWHFTTSAESHLRAARVCEDAELRVCGDAKDDSAFVRSYSKRAVDNVNYLSIGPDEWICTAGTLIVDGRLGGDALPLFHERYAREGLNAARSAAIGHYAVCIRQGGRVTAFTDEQAAMPLFYGSPASRQCVVSNSLQVAAVALGATDADPYQLIAAVLHGVAVGPDTHVKGVKRLFGSQAIEIDLATSELRVLPVSLGIDRLGSHELTDIQTATQAYASRMQGVFSQLAAQSSVGLHVTGGLDTRTVLAGLMAAHERPLLMYGVGNSDLTGTRAHDLETARALASALQLPLKEMDWSGTQPFSDARLSSLYRRYGFLYAYGMSDGFLTEMEGKSPPHPQLQLSGYGPLQVVRAPRPDPVQGIAGLAGEMCSLERRILTPQAYSAYLPHVTKAVRQAVAALRLDLADGGLTVEQHALAYAYLFMPMNAANAAFFNEFTFHLAPLLTKKLFDPVMTGPMPYQADGAFQLRVIHALAPQLLGVPVRSGDGARSLDTESLTLRPMFSSRFARLRRSAFCRLVPSSLRQAVVSRLGLWRMPGLPGLSSDTAKDARVSDAARRYLVRRMHSDYPSVSGMQSRSRFPLDRLHALFCALHGLREMRVNQVLLMSSRSNRQDADE